jgi:hypothetical protein
MNNIRWGWVLFAPPSTSLTRRGGGEAAKTLPFRRRRDAIRFDRVGVLCRSCLRRSILNIRSFRYSFDAHIPEVL